MHLHVHISDSDIVFPLVLVFMPSVWIGRKCGFNGWVPGLVLSCLVFVRLFLVLIFFFVADVDVA